MWVYPILFAMESMPLPLKFVAGFAAFLIAAWSCAQAVEYFVGKYKQFGPSLLIAAHQSWLEAPWKSTLLVAFLTGAVCALLGGITFYSWAKTRSMISKPTPPAPTAVAAHIPMPTPPSPDQTPTPPAMNLSRNDEDSADRLAAPRSSPPPPVGIESLFSKPLLPPDAEEFVVLVNGRPQIPQKFTVGELKQKSRKLLFSAAGVPIPIAEIYIKEGLLCVDATTIEGVRIRENHFTDLPPGWDYNGNDFAVEIINDEGVPVYQLKRARPLLIEFNGVILCNEGKGVATIWEHPSGEDMAGRLFGPAMLRAEVKDGVRAPPAVIINIKRMFKYPSGQFRGQLEGKGISKQP